MKKILKPGFGGTFCCFTLCFLASLRLFPWGFFAHKNINRLAIFTLPVEMAGFYKRNIHFITETAVAPDKRRYIVKEEGARHFIDMDYYLDSLHLKLPMDWKSIDSLVPEEARLKHGMLPWHLQLMKYKLTEAFKVKNEAAILKLSAEIGHYISDAHVPLHTCSNYNGQLTNQHGIHGLWESRIPELDFENYDFWTGPAVYLDQTAREFWKVVFESHQESDSVLSLEKKLSQDFPEDQKYTFEQRGGGMVKTYSREYCRKYDELLKGQIERKMRASVRMTGSIWYTCWIDAGQPDLNDLRKEVNKQEEEAKDTLVTELHDCSGH